VGQGQRAVAAGEGTRAESGLALKVRMRRGPWTADSPIATRVEADSPTVTQHEWLWAWADGGSVDDLIPLTAMLVDE
jgi:hypothetical protein